MFSRSRLLFPKITLERATLFIFFVLLIWSFFTLEGPDRRINYLENFFRFLGRFFPPDFSEWRDLAKELKETIRIACIATAIAFVTSIPLALGSSRLHQSQSLRISIRVILSAVRTIPSIIWALIAVAVLGPHSVAGVVALTFYSLGYLAKFLSDSIDSLDLQVFRHLRATGADPIQSFQYGLWPSLKPLSLSHLIWMLEYNIRSAAIIGYVGAGGLGSLLHQYQEFYQWDRFCAVLIVIFAIVLGFDGLSERLRARLRVERTHSS